MYVYDRYMCMFGVVGGLSDGNHPLMHFSCGLVAGGAASIATQPADVVKTHMQLQPQKFSRVQTVVVYIYQVSTFDI